MLLVEMRPQKCPSIWPATLVLDLEFSPMPPATPPETPDCRYLVVRGRLWRKSNPQLAPDDRDVLVQNLMNARRMLVGQHSANDRAAARRDVDEAKRALGERGPVWWTDGAPDYNRKMAKNTPYAAWFASRPSDGPSTT